jgi:ParB family chromosome partitioning protein
MNSPKKDKPKHLGRGLESLMGSILNTGQELSDNSAAEKQHNFPVDKDLRKSWAEIPVSKIVPNPFQPRQTWNDDQLKDLSNSIRENGIIQPIIVRQKGVNKYEIIAGGDGSELPNWQDLTKCLLW